jgi:hypothetical protein
MQNPFTIDALGQPLVDTILSIASRCVDRSAPRPDLAAIELLLDYVGSSLSSSEADSPIAFARSGFLRLYMTLTEKYRWKPRWAIGDALGFRTEVSMMHNHQELIMMTTD